MSSEWIPEDLRPRARSLSDDVGVDEFAWDRSTALELVTRLAGAGVSILGGDVYVEEAGRIRPTYANWACERTPNEELSAFTERSTAEAKRYLESYMEAPGQQTFYVFVVSTEQTAGM
ncbi:MAG: Imm40 family immunity protein [Proteobacteria bacterium]|nr:Imm40 family immunity protein [Pseudomonadota bacterium]